VGNYNTRFWEDIRKQEIFIRNRLKSPDSQLLIKNHGKKCVEAVLRQEYHHTRIHKPNTYISDKDIHKARQITGRKR